MKKFFHSYVVPLTIMFGGIALGIYFLIYGLNERRNQGVPGDIGRRLCAPYQMIKCEPWEIETRITCHDPTSPNETKVYWMKTPKW